MGKFFKLAAKKDETEIVKKEYGTPALAGGAALIGGATAYEFGPHKMKYKTKTYKKPLQKDEKILLISADRAFGSGHAEQSAAFEKVLKEHGHTNVKVKPIHEYAENYEQARPMLVDIYNKKRATKAPQDIANWVSAEKAVSQSASVNLAKDIPNYDRVFSFTGDSSVNMLMNKDLNKAVQKSSIPTHLVVTDRDTGGEHFWWTARDYAEGPREYKLKNYSSVHLPDEPSVKSFKKFHGNVNIQKSNGLSVNIDSMKPTQFENVGYFVHGGSTGTNMLEAGKNFEKLHEAGELDKDVVLLAGGSASDEVKTGLKAIADKTQGSTGAKIHYVEKLQKPEMNHLMSTADINVATAGGTTLEELGAMGKPALFMHSLKDREYSHIGKVTSRMLKGDKDYAYVLNNNIHDLAKADESYKGTPAWKSGSDTINLDDHESFKKQLTEFKSTYNDRVARAAEGKGEFGQGAKDLYKYLTEDGTVVKNFGRRLPFGLTAGAAAVGAGAITYGLLADHKGRTNKEKKESFLSNKAKVGIGVGAGAVTYGATQGVKKLKEFNVQLRPLMSLDAQKRNSMLSELKSNYNQVIKPAVNYKKSPIVKYLTNLHGV